tara:strand:- start:12142 stop:13200 length:1059 start_codon:yes stop_codon:yes gene_type:complete
MSIEAENVNENIEPTSPEEQFFGVKHDVTTNVPDDIEVEIQDEESAAEPEPVVEEKQEPITDEDLDKEIAAYSERAGKRINKLVYEREQEKQQREKTTKEKDEAVERIKTLMKQNEQLQKQVDIGSQELNKSISQGADWVLQFATMQLEKANEEGDPKKIAAATQLLTQAQQAKATAPTYAQRVAEAINSGQYQGQTNMQPAPAPVQEPEPTEQQTQEVEDNPALKEWLSNNSWFLNNKNRDMTAYATYLEEEFAGRGLYPNSPNFYDELDNAMKIKFPNFYGIQETTAVEAKAPVEEAPVMNRQASQVVAPVSRTTGKTPRKVQLSAEQVRLARQLGISNEQYAAELLKEN